MALSLERVQKSTVKKTKVSSPRKVVSRRPWQNHNEPSTESLSFAPLMDLSFNEIDSFPSDLDVSSSTQLCQILLRHHWGNQLQSWRKNHYWLARLTHKQSWWARLKLYPEFQFPIPSWMSSKTI